MSNAPVKKFRVGFVSASVWKNDASNGFYSVTFQRAYRDGDTIKNTDSFGAADLPVLAVLASRAEAWIASQSEG